MFFFFILCFLYLIFEWMSLCMQKTRCLWLFIPVHSHKLWNGVWMCASVFLALDSNKKREKKYIFNGLSRLFSVFCITTLLLPYVHIQLVRIRWWWWFLLCFIAIKKWKNAFSYLTMNVFYKLMIKRTPSHPHKMCVVRYSAYVCVCISIRFQK